MRLRLLALAFAAVMLGSTVAPDAEARKGGRSGGQGSGGSGKSWHGKGHGSHGGHKHPHGGHKHRHGHVSIGAGFYGPWFYDPWYSWYPPLYPYPVAAPIVLEQQYIEQYAVPLQPGFWYYCHSGGAYYPGVAECPEGWEQVVPQ